MLTRKMQVRNDELVPLNLDAFCYKKDGSLLRGGDKTVRGSAASQQENRQVHKIIDAILNPSVNEEQIVLALRKASTHRYVRRFFKSSGMIDDEENETRKYTMNQMKDIINLATATENSQGRATDDKRSIVQSILLGIASSPTKNGGNKKSHQELPGTAFLV